jgi:hypothetical protein
VPPPGSVSTRLLPIPAKETPRPPFMTTYEQPGGATFYQQRMMSSPNSISGLTEGPRSYNSNLHSTSANRAPSRFCTPQQPSITPPLIDLPISNMGASMSDNRSASGINNDDVLQDELSVMSQLLLGQQFNELDR